MNVLLIERRKECDHSHLTHLIYDIDIVMFSATVQEVLYMLHLRVKDLSSLVPCLLEASC